MALIKFYKTGEKWVIGDYDGYPAGTCVRHIDPTSGIIRIRPANAPSNSDKSIATGKPTEFCNADGTAYADLAAFKAATDDFFVKAAGITSGVQITNALGYTPENAAKKGVANGYAPLDSGSKVPATNLPSALAVGTIEAIRSQSTDKAVASKLFDDKTSDNEISDSLSSNDVSFYSYGTIIIDNSSKTITIANGGFLNRKGLYSASTKTFDFSSLGQNTYALFSDPYNSYFLSVSAYNVDVSTTKNKQICILRFDCNASNNIIAVHYSIGNYILDGITNYKTVNQATFNTYNDNRYLLPQASLANKLSLSSNDAFYTMPLTIDTAGGVATLENGYVLSRSRNIQINVSNSTLSITLSAGDYYVFWIDVVSKVFGYNNWSSYSDSEHKFILCRVHNYGGTIKVHDSNCPYLKINGIYVGVDGVLNRLLTLESQTVTSKTYCEIGDSISWQFDGKKENFASELPGQSGYKALGGYGQKICKKFGISYNNHKSHGLNGRTFAEYIYEVLTTTSTDAVFDVPQDADIYTIFLGTNDWGKSARLGTISDFLNDTLNINDFTNTNTIYGALRKLLDYVGSTSVSSKDKKIVFITPIGFGAYSGYGAVTSTWMIDNGQIVERANSSGVKMSDIVNAIKFAANQVGAYVIDLYNYNGLVQKQRLNISLQMNGSVPYVYQGVLGDNLHPTQTGHLWLGNYICGELSKIIVTDSF